MELFRVPEKKGSILLPLPGSDRLGIEIRRMAQERNLSKEWSALMDEFHPAWEKQMEIFAGRNAHFAQTGIPPEDFLDQLDAAIRTVDELKQRPRMPSLRHCGGVIKAHAMCEGCSE